MLAGYRHALSVRPASATSPGRDNRGLRGGPAIHLVGGAEPQLLPAATVRIDAGIAHDLTYRVEAALLQDGRGRLPVGLDRGGGAACLVGNLETLGDEREIYPTLAEGRQGIGIAEVGHAVGLDPHDDIAGCLSVERGQIDEG